MKTVPFNLFLEKNQILAVFQGLRWDEQAARGAPGMVEFPGTVERLPNGNTLIADGGDELGLGAEVVEVDP